MMQFALNSLCVYGYRHLAWNITKKYYRTVDIVKRKAAAPHVISNHFNFYW